MVGLKVNGVDLTAMNLRLQGLPGFDNAPARQVVSVAAGSQFGAYALRIDGAGAKRLQIEAAAVRDSVANRIIAVQNFKALSDAGLSRLELDLGGGAIRLQYGILDGEPGWQSPRSFRSGVSLFKASYLCPSPLWLSPAGRPVALAVAATRYPLEMGTGPTPLIARIMGSATGPIFTIRDAWGNPQLVLQFPNLTSTEYIDLDTRKPLIEKVSSSARTNAMALTNLVTGRLPFALDPSMGDYANLMYPTAEVSNTTGEILYVERWL